MIDNVIEQGNNLQKLIISPNRAMHWQDLVVVFLIISIITLGIGVFFFINGFPLILPFSGVELLLLGYALYVTSWRATTREVVIIGDNTVAVEKGHKQLEKSYHFSRFWTKVKLEKPAFAWHPSRLLICSQGKQLEIGEFLNEEERRGLATVLVDAIAKPQIYNEN